MRSFLIAVLRKLHVYITYCKVQGRRESKMCLKDIWNKHALVYTFDLRCNCLQKYTHVHSHLKLHNGAKILILSKVHILKISLFTKFTFSTCQFSQNSQFQNLIFDKIHIFKISFLTKFTILKSYFSLNSQFQNFIFDKIHIFKVSFFTKFTFFSNIKFLVISG